MAKNKQNAARSKATTEKAKAGKSCDDCKECK